MEKSNNQTVINIYLECPKCNEEDPTEIDLPPRDYNPLKRRIVWEGYVENFDYNATIVD